MAKFLNEEGEEVEGFTKEEYEAKEKEAADAKAEAEESKKHLAEKTDEFVKAKQGFKRFSEMTEEEKAKLSAEQQSTMQQLEELKTTQEKERNIAKDAMFKNAARGDEKVLAAIKEKYALVHMPEGTTEEVMARINAVTPWAYADLGIIERKPTPIETTIISGGDVPRVRDDEKKRFAETEQGKQMADTIFPGLKDNK